MKVCVHCHSPRDTGDRCRACGSTALVPPPKRVPSKKAAPKRWRTLSTGPR